MRGKQGAVLDDFDNCGITPADAGKTLSQSESGIGESGSPPRMRGKHVAAAQVKPRRRITPADAGKTLEAPKYVKLQCGSPPRMRGKRRVCRAGCHKHGITPADAGKTSHKIDVRAGKEDHPRGCGENFLFRPARRLS